MQPPEYESDHTTAFIFGQEVFSVQGRKADNSEIARKIREVRKSLGLKQEGFAERLDFDQTTISKWESAKARPTPDALVRIASVAGQTDTKRFFLAQAGIPFSDAGDIDFGLESLAHQPRQDAKAALGHLNQGNKEPKRKADRDYAWDRELLIFVIETIDSELKKRGRKLPSHKYAEMVALSYEFCHRTGQRDSSIVERLLKIA